MSAGQLVGVLYKPLLLHVHQDLLTTHGADVVRQAPARHPPPAVVLRARPDFKVLTQQHSAAAVRRHGATRCSVCAHMTYKLQNCVTYSDRGRHVVGADFGEVSAHDAVVEPVEQHDHADVHGVFRLDPNSTDRRERRGGSEANATRAADACLPEEDVEAEHGEHDVQVAQHAHRVAQLVDQQEPLVHHPANMNRSHLPMSHCSRTTI